ncbi:hypothetical protein [Methanoculleus chikugoensis]|uniref:glycerophosphodiester phosphodiesterase n=1 Tax=Methanoculleus chikugoensis TaxID=118126 RepID=UPI001FB32592|nr:glycerophosphodiester phosphodiesterase family protein [Methanoculleus chikugoensis]
MAPPCSSSDTGGARALGPENTLSALRRGMACADLVEVDLRLTRDGILVAIHDATVDRTTNGTGPVKGGYTIEDLTRLDAGGGGGEKIPTLGGRFSTSSATLRGGLSWRSRSPGRRRSSSRRSWR